MRTFWEQSHHTAIKQREKLKTKTKMSTERAVKNKYVAVKNHIDGSPKDTDFELKVETFSLIIESGKKVVKVKNLYLSVDPYQINRMKFRSASQAAIDFASQISLGQEIDTYGVGRVVESGNPEYEKDELVCGLLTWGEYTTVKEGGLLNKLDPLGFPLSYHVGVLAFSGLTAYAGFYEICKPKKGEKVFVSAASGSVGSLVGQYAKLFGCYVVGCAGSQNKVDLLKEKLGFDDAFNYKEESDLKSALKRYFPDGIDIYFDNVGAQMQEAAVANMNTFGRVCVCGVISEYTGEAKPAAPNMLNIIYKRITIQGFLAADHMNVYKDFISTTAEYLREGKLESLEDISDGVESIVPAFLGLFDGQNVGKKIIRVADE